ncbi:MAG: hypothetical protein IIW23_02560 [Clostridia bacterium]|nr:hypothetical protein [Clostridia bacterium]
MKKILALCLCFIIICFALPVASAAPNRLIRVTVGLEWDYYFAALGQELTISTELEGGSESDLASFKPTIRYTKESTSFDEATGFKWIDIPSDGSAKIKWTPTEEGVYCFSAECQLPGSKKTISSLDGGMPIVLVVDMEKKAVVKNAEEFTAALSSGTHYISIQGDVVLKDMGSLNISQQVLLEIAKEGTLTLSGTELRLGNGRWNIGSTVIIDGTLKVEENATVMAGEYPVDVYVSGLVDGFDLKQVPKIQYIPLNVSPFEEFTGTYIEDKATGITTVIENMSNATLLSVSLLDPAQTLYGALAALDDGEVIIAFESEITEYDGKYTLSIPVDAKYNGKELTVYLLDKTVVGYVEPIESKATCQNGRVAITVDKNNIVMIKTAVSKIDTKTIAIIGAAAAALILMIVLVVIPAVAGGKKNKKEEKE